MELIISVIVIIGLSSCNNSIKKQKSVLSISRTELHSSPDFYMFAFHSASRCGIDFLSPENVNKIIINDGGMDCGDLFCCKTASGYRGFTARHVFLGCDDNPDLKVENYDVVSLPLNFATNGFEMAKPEIGDTVTLKGFRIINGSAEWLEMCGILQTGILNSMPEEYHKKITWNPGMAWLIKVDSTFTLENMKGFSGSPIFNKNGKVVACFSGIYNLPYGIFLRVEELIK